LAKFNNDKFENQEGIIARNRRIRLKEYFFVSDNEGRNASILKALHGGYTQAEIAGYLKLSSSAVSRIVSRERAKQKLFASMRNKGLFWSYAADIEYDIEKSGLLIETVLKYADLDDIKNLLGLFGIRRIKQIWENRVKNDVRFTKLNYFLARILFKMDVEAEDFTNVNNTRTEKFRLLAG